MKTRISVNKKIFAAAFVSLVAVLAIFLFLPSKTIIAHAAFGGYSSEKSREDLHAETIATTVNTDAPTITFLTHGLDGKAGHWSNTMHLKDDDWLGSSDFSYDSASIIEKIRAQIPSGIRLYVARMSISADSPYVFDANSFFLREYELDDPINPTEYKLVADDKTIISDFSQHVVIVFDLQNDYDKTNAQVYEELEYVIDKISYDYFVVMGVLPKINLIGHSRGGLINMDYAINHPKNVASLISIGTPYNGSWYDNWFVELLGVNDFSSVGGADIVDTTLISERKNDWNSVYAQNTHINFHAISGTTALSLMNHIVWNHHHLETHLKIGAAVGIRTAYVLSPIVVAGGLYVLPGDICVDKSSQEADGFDGLTNNRFNKEFTSSNSNCNKRAKNHLPVPHNLETYDIDIHNYILDKVDFAAPFNTTYLANNNIRMDRANFTPKGAFEIPATINGRSVTEIGNSAFANKTQLSHITIPSSVGTTKSECVA